MNTQIPRWSLSSDLFTRYRRLAFGSVTLFLANLGALTDAVLHPEIPYFDEEHLMVGGATALTVGFLLYILEGYLCRHDKTCTELRESESQIRALIDNALVGVGILSGSQIIFANGALLDLFGCTRDELIGTALPDSVVSEFREMILQRLAGEAHGETVSPAFEFSIRCKDGVTRSLHATSSAICWRGQPCRQMVLIDITARRQAELALREKEERLRMLFDGSRDAILVHEFVPGELPGKFIEANAEATRRYGYTHAELLEMRPMDLDAPEGLAAIPAAMQRLQAEGHASWEGMHRTRDGRKIAVEINNVVFNYLGRTMIMATARDITERKQAEDEHRKLEALNRQLLKSESLGRLAGAVAHHFNNHRQAMRLSLERVTNSQLQKAEPLEGLVEAQQSARKAAEVSTLMLTYLGQAQVETAPLDLAEVCQQSLALLRSAMPRGVVLETDLPTSGPVISANANQLQQVLTNLMTNAWEASGEGPGALRLSVKTVSAVDIPAAVRFPINWQPQDNATTYACLEVADAGGGIAAKDFDKLFDPFFSTKFTGRGLGLPVVLGIARSHDGVVTVESEPGRGSTFRIFFPVSAEAVPRKADQVRLGPISANVQQRATVLVVEDEPAVRKTLSLELRRSGFTVLEAEDGVAAVAMFQQHRNEIGCVVCDLTMPRMNGWETLTALRQLVPGIGVILASGYSEAQAMAGDHPERPQAFLHKPYDAKVLINAINQILPSNA